MARERISSAGETKLKGLLAAKRPKRAATRMLGVLKKRYDRYITSAISEIGAATVTQLALDLQNPNLLSEGNWLGRTLKRWKTQISNWYPSRVSNGPTEAANNLLKRVKCFGFGFTNFKNYRIRALLYAGKPNWNLLSTLTPT